MKKKKPSITQAFGFVRTAFVLIGLGSFPLTAAYGQLAALGNSEQWALVAQRQDASKMPAQNPANPADVSIGNKFLSREISVSNGLVKTVAIENKLTKQRIEVVSEEFLLELEGGKYLTTSDFRLFSRSSGRTERGGSREEFILTGEGLPLEVKLEYQVDPDDFYLRKRVWIRSNGLTQPIVRRLEVERIGFRLPAGDLSHEQVRTYPIDPPNQKEIAVGKLGQPVFAEESLFVGLEYPAAQNVKIAASAQNGYIVVCAHYPGRRVRPDYWSSKSAVLGVAQTGELEDYFLRYVRSIRVPPRPFLIYHTWFDARGNDMTPEFMLRVEEGYRKNLTDKYGIKMNAIAPNEGFQNSRAIGWMPDPQRYPQGFEALARELERRGTTLGYYMPLVTYAYPRAFSGYVRHDIDWGIKQGLELSDATGDAFMPVFLDLYDRRPQPLPLPQYYCLSAPNYNREIRAAIRYHIQKSRVSFFYHDFCLLYCSASGHGHIPEFIYGFEANVDAQIELLKYEREMRPDIFLSVTSFMWLSPWWLQQADSVFRGYSDPRFEEKVPAVRVRDRAMSYVDSVLYNDFRRDGFQFPITALMNADIVHGNLEKHAGDKETLDSWADFIVHVFGRGTRLQEFYMNPFLLSDEKWEVLGKTLQWDRANGDLLTHTTMVGGDPKKAQPFGYVHWANGRGIVCLRNPSLERQTINVRLRGLEGKPLKLMVTYPYTKLLPGIFNYNQQVPVDLESYQVMVIEAYPNDSFPHTQLVTDARYRVVDVNDGGVVLDIEAGKGSVRVEDPGRFKLFKVNGSQLRVGRDGNVPIGGRAMPQGELQWQRTGSNQLVVTLPQNYVNHTQLLFLMESVERSGPKIDAPVIEVNAQKVDVAGDSGHSDTGVWYSFQVPLRAEKNDITWVLPEVRSVEPSTKTLLGLYRIGVWALVQAPLPTVRLTLEYSKAGNSFKGPLLPVPLAHTERGFYRLIPSLESR